MSLYREKIIDHYNNPRNSGEIKSADCTSHVDNPLCGDIVAVSMKLDHNTITDIKFDAEGCAISIAALSMLSEKVKGSDTKEVEKITLTDIKKMLGIELGPTRLKCAEMGLIGIKKCLHTNKNSKKK